MFFLFFQIFLNFVLLNYFSTFFLFLSLMFFCFFLFFILSSQNRPYFTMITLGHHTEELGSTVNSVSIIQTPEGYSSSRIEISKMGQFFILRSRVQHNGLLVNALNRIFKSSMSLNTFKWLLTKVELSCVRNIIPRSRKSL